METITNNSLDTTASFPRMHVSLYVSNLENTIKFYTEFFGIEPIKVKIGYAKYVLKSPSLIISFVENPERVMANFGHIGFQVETQDDLLTLHTIMQNKNMIAKEEMGVSCCYAVQDKFWVNDPDGVQWEIYYFHSDAEFNDPNFEFDEATACCMPQNHTTVEEIKNAPNTKLAEVACCVPGVCC